MTASIRSIEPGIEMQLVAKRYEAVGISLDEALEHLLQFPGIKPLGFKPTDNLVAKLVQVGAKDDGSLIVY